MREKETKRGTRGTQTDTKRRRKSQRQRVVQRQINVSKISPKKAKKLSGFESVRK